ncbi:MAG: hypothetical protein ACK4TO_09045 [Candidatus Nitrosotenuis sp.]
MNIFLIQAARQKPLIALASAIGIFFLNPLIQSVNTSLALQIWFLDIVQKPLSSIPYFAFSILFGMFMSLYFFAKKSCVDCKTNAKSGIGGTALGFMIGVCPACFSFIGFLLPLSGSLFLSSYSPLFIMVSIGIILFSIHRMGGFKVVSVVKSQN